MKSIFYLLTILFLSLLIACSEEPPTNVEIESLSKKPVPPPPPDPLPALVQGTNYIAGDIAGGRRIDPKVFIWDGSDLTNKWSRSIEAFTINGLGIGDFIGDDDKELIVQRRIISGRGRNKTEKQELLIFQEGDTEPSQTVLLREWNGFPDAVWDMKIGNVDNDEELEIVILFRDQLEIWEYDGNDFFLSAYIDYFSSSDSPWRADIGDFDGDLVNDDIIVAFSSHLWRVYKYNGSSITEVIESSVYNESGSLDCAKMSDVDYNGDIEVIGGKWPNKVLLWEYPYEDQNAIVASQEFPYAPWAVGVGELDNDQSNGKEILAGVTQNGGLHLLHYNGSSLIYEEELVPG